MPALIRRLGGGETARGMAEHAHPVGGDHLGQPARQCGEPVQHEAGVADPGAERLLQQSRDGAVALGPRELLEELVVGPDRAVGNRTPRSSQRRADTSWRTRRSAGTHARSSG
jgi:hypothetical protein